MASGSIQSNQEWRVKSKERTKREERKIALKLKLHKNKNNTNMVNYLLMITADLENLTNLQPQGGCDDPDFSYLFKVSLL